MSTDLLSSLRAHELIHQATDEAELARHLSTGGAGGAGRGVYSGFDPTADSLTIGHLVPMLVLAHFQRAGHTPFALMGGGTGLIGDPSGKSAERQLRTRDEIEANVASIKKIFQRVLDFSPGKHQARLVNNIDWLGKLSYIDALRDIGKHFSVNVMMQKDSVRERLHNREQGISYTEFSYMILQAYDFYHLHAEHGVTVQLGGSDQWGNIVAGIELIRKKRAHGEPGEELPAFGITAPLVLKADGTKFGKTESGAVWLTADKTSPYAFYQYWLNVADADAPVFLRKFTFLSPQELAEAIAAHQQDPGQRTAQRLLAQHVTDLIHGKVEREQAEAAARALFSGEVAAIPEKTFDEVFSAVPSSAHAKASLEGEGLSVLELLPQTTIAASKSQARQLLSEGSISVNGQKVGPDARLTSASLLHGRVVALRRGKKTWHVTRWA